MQIKLNLPIIITSEKEYWSEVVRKQKPRATLILEAYVKHDKTKKQ